MNRTKIDNYKNRDWLNQKYTIEKLGIYQIAPLCNCHPRTIHSWLVKFNIPRRKGGVEHWSEEQRELRRKWNKNHPEINRMKGKNHSLETKLKMSIKRQKERNGNWRGGKTYTERLYKKSSEYQQWRKSVLIRDNYSCKYKDCNIITKIAHHIKPYKEYPELRIEISNGMTICEKHHKEIHKELCH